MSHFKIFAEAEKLLSTSDPEPKAKSQHKISIEYILEVNSDLIAQSQKDVYIDESLSFEQTSEEDLRESFIQNLNVPKVVVVSDDEPSDSDPFRSLSSGSNKLRKYCEGSASSDENFENRETGQMLRRQVRVANIDL